MSIDPHCRCLPLNQYKCQTWHLYSQFGWSFMIGTWPLDLCGKQVYKDPSTSFWIRDYERDVVQGSCHGEGLRHVNSIKDFWYIVFYQRQWQKSTAIQG